MSSNLRLILTEDGSHSLKNESLNETYHSFHGAVQESTHVFIKKGLQYWCNYFSGIPRILEIGFGTGLNAFLTLLYAEDHQQLVDYVTLETLPLNAGIYKALNYAASTERPEKQGMFERLHASPWEEKMGIGDYLSLTKRAVSVHDFHSPAPFNIIYFDAFAPSKQPDMWAPEVIQKMYDLLAANGILVTYCAQGQFKRNLKQAGFVVEELPGPPGKKEMVRAAKKAG